MRISFVFSSTKTRLYGTVLFLRLFQPHTEGAIITRAKFQIRRDLRTPHIEISGTKMPAAQDRRGLPQLFPLLPFLIIQQNWRKGFFLLDIISLRQKWTSDVWAGLAVLWSSTQTFSWVPLRTLLKQRQFFGCFGDK